MESLEALVAHVQGLSGGDGGDLSQLLAVLKHSDDSLRAQAVRLPEALAQLHPRNHTLGYLFLLEAYLTAPATRDEASSFLSRTIEFIDSCVAEQINLVPEKFVSICKSLKDQVMLLQVPIRGVAPLKTAIRKLQTSTSTEKLTALHPDFLLLCILARTYKAALSILEDDIYEVDQPRDFFLCCYYGGMIYIGLKQFSKALEWLHNAFTAPMVTLNAIVVEAYKKYILVSLIQNGQLPSFQKYTASTAQRNLKNHTQIYVELANLYASGSYTELEMYILLEAEKFQSDNNLGLAKQVLSSLYKRNIQRLTQNYLTLSLQDIANAVQLKSAKEAELHVLRMIQDGEIFATINQKDGMVSFHEDPEQYKTCEMVEHIDSSIKRLMNLSKKLTAVDEQIACDPAYQSKVGRDRTRYDFDDFESVQHKFL